MRLLRHCAKSFHRVFLDPTQKTLREVQRRLDTMPFVKIHVAARGEPFEGTFYLVTEIDWAKGRIAWFNPYNHSNMSTEWSSLGSIAIDLEQTFDLKPNWEFNALIWQISRDNKPYNRNEYRRRLGYDHRSHPIYIRKGLHVHEGTAEYRSRWGNVAVFQVAALEVDRGGENIEAFSYYAGYGTYGIDIDIGEWEPNPRYVDYDKRHRDALHREYLEYKAKPPFEEGDIIRSRGFQDRVFIRYEDPDRTRMIVYPGKLIEGAECIARFELIERRGV